MKPNLAVRIDLPQQSSGGESHGINVLWLLTEEMRVGVWKTNTTMGRVESIRSSSPAYCGNRVCPTGCMFRARTRWPTWNRVASIHVSMISSAPPFGDRGDER